MDEPAAPALSRTVGARLWREYVTDVRAGADARVRPGPAADRRAVVILLTTAVALTCAEFLARRDRGPLGGLAVWAVVTIGCYVVPPVLVIRVVFGERVRDFGLRVRGIGAHWRPYAVLFAVAFPFVVVASFGEGFQDKYPFLDLAPGESSWPDLPAWWALYWAQFAALEFFFRGFLVHGLAPRFGWTSVFVMVVPYNMIHFDKPMTEALAAIVGGTVLGALSLKTRSIWWGAALHVAIAATMDVCALVHAGRIVAL